MIIRPAQASDASSIARIHVDTWRSTYTGILPEEYLAKLSYEKREQGWYDSLSSDTFEDIVFVAKDQENGVIAFASGGKVRGDQPIFKGELYGIYVLEGFQRKGIGTKLMTAVAEQLVKQGFDSMLVWVLADNPACSFYEALGGRRVSDKKISLGGGTFVEIGYGWKDIQSITTGCT